MSMENIFKIASSVATPLALGGFFAAILFLVIRQILSGKFFVKLTSANSAKILKLIIDRLFILALIAMLLGSVAYVLINLVGVKSNSPQISISGSFNTAVNGSNNVVSVNSDLSIVLRERSRVIPVSIPVHAGGHSISSFEFQEEIPSIQINKINSLIKESVLKIYRKNDFYKRVAIVARPRFIEYGLVGISIDVELEEMDIKALDVNTPEKEAVFLLYMAGAHPLQKSTGLVINIANAEPYEFKDLFRFDAMSEVSAQMASILMKNEQFYSCVEEKKIDPRLKFDSKILERYLGYSIDGCFSSVRPNANFYLTSSAIVVKYSRYEIGPGMLGAPEVSIPFVSIKNYVNPNGPLAFVATSI